MQKEKYPLLYQINSPSDLKKLPEEAMPALCLEIRRFLVEHVKKTGGHLASNLGIVEITVAFHRIFDSPHDRLIFDVGHQSYVHKLLTGRRDAFDTLRSPGGLSGFTKRSESEHDPFGAGHSSTSVSAALGFAVSDKLAARDSYSVALLGDGAFTGGMIHEALNNVSPDLRLVIVLNENEMSISKNIGGFAKYIARIRASRGYIKAKNRAKSVLNSIPVIGAPLYNAASEAKQLIKNSLYSSNYFEELGLFYIGPADGNDYESVHRLLSEAKSKKRSVIVHLKTKKGKGYLPAEKEPNKYHGILPKGKTTGENYSSVMGRELTRLARRDTRVCAITAAMCESTGLSPFKAEHRERFFDVGIAEEHALTFSAALACEGLRPYFAVYSSFLQRGYDNLVHDIALQRLPVTILIDRAALASGDGPTHHGIYDVAMLGSVPDMTLFAPASYASLSKALQSTLTLNSPSAVRYPNDTEHKEILDTFKFGDLLPKADYNRVPGTVIVTYGKITLEALSAEKKLKEMGIDAGVLLLEKLMPYKDVAKEAEAKLRGASHLIFVEEGIRAGGVGMMLSDALRSLFPEYASKVRIDVLAIENGAVWGEAGRSLYESAGISKQDIINTVLNK